MRGKSFAMACGIKRQNKTKKMSQGGEVKKTVGQIIGYPGSGSNPIKKSRGGLIEAIRAKHRDEDSELNSQTPDDPFEQSEPILEELNEAASDDNADNDSEDGLKKRNRVAAIRAKMRK